MGHADAAPTWRNLSDGKSASILFVHHENASLHLIEIQHLRDCYAQRMMGIAEITFDCLGAIVPGAVCICSAVLE